VEDVERRRIQELQSCAGKSRILCRVHPNAVRFLKDTGESELWRSASRAAARTYQREGIGETAATAAFLASPTGLPLFTVTGAVALSRWLLPVLSFGATSPAQREEAVMSRINWREVFKFCSGATFVGTIGTAIWPCTTSPCRSLLD